MFRNIWVRFALIFLLFFFVLVAIGKALWYVLITVLFLDVNQVDREAKRLLRMWDDDNER